MSSLKFSEGRKYEKTVIADLERFKDLHLKEFSSLVSVEMNSNLREISMEAVAAAILPYLLPRDVLQLSLVSRDFHDLFDSNKVWKKIFDRFFDVSVLRDADFEEIDWKMSCANLLQQSLDDFDLHQKFCISSKCCFKSGAQSEQAEVCLKPSKAHMNLLDWDFTTIEYEPESSSDSETLVQACIEDLRRTSPASLDQLISPLQSVNQGSNTNLLANSSASESSIIVNAETKIPEAKPESIQSAAPFFKFTREALQKRLQNLVSMSSKKSNGDPELTLPGNLTKKFALRYRTE